MIAVVRRQRNMGSLGGERKIALSVWEIQLTAFTKRSSVGLSNVRAILFSALGYWLFEDGASGGMYRLGADRENSGGQAQKAFATDEDNIKVFYGE